MIFKAFCSIYRKNTTFDMRLKFKPPKSQNLYIIYSLKAMFFIKLNPQWNFTAKDHIFIITDDISIPSNNKHNIYFIK